jgi:putative NIF3 family GTP cyclohydrolase 1 type 2
MNHLISNNSLSSYTVLDGKIECILAKRNIDKLYSSVLNELPTANVDIVSLDKLPQFDAGSGRLVTLNTPVPLSSLSNTIKEKLNLSHLRIALPWEHKGNLESVKIQTIAICAGSGKSVFGRCKADLLFTGELDHHFVLSSVESGSAVICTEHSNSERGYLPYLMAKLEKLFSNSISFIVSSEDRDPLRVY